MAGQNRSRKCLNKHMLPDFQFMVSKIKEDNVPVCISCQIVSSWSGASTMKMYFQRLAARLPNNGRKNHS